MKNILYTAFAVILLLFSACESKFLELEPLDRQTEASYFNEPTHFKAAANDFYSKLLSWRRINESNIFDFMDMGSDLMSLAKDYGRGIISTSQKDIYWTNNYAYIRSNNILLEKADEYTGDKNEIREYVAAAKFFRAYHHFFLLQRFGGVPIITEVLIEDSPELYAKRNSRYEVIDQILTDLDDAMVDLPLERDISSEEKGHISKEAAQAFKAKVLLFEATWERYVGTTTDGDGTGQGAGTTKPEGYLTIEEMLQEAINLSKNIIDFGGFELWDYSEDLGGLSTCYLFTLDTYESNPAGLDKTSNNEYIFYSKYDFELRQAGEQISHTVGYSLAPSRKMMDMFLCTDGLPVDKSALFQGYTQTSDEYQNRDSRLVSYFASNSTWSIPENGSVNLEGPGGSSGSGYGNRKFFCYNYGSYREAREESYDYPHIRLAEVYLIYAEAIYELNGAIGDAELDQSINKTKSRAGLPPLTNAFAMENGLDIKEEIRRERAIELFGENNRYLDLMRWGIAEEMLNHPICGSVIEGTNYEDNPELYSPNAYPYGEITVGTGVGERRVLQLDPASNRNFSRSDYLFPIPLDEIEQNENLLQNPGY